MINEPSVQNQDQRPGVDIFEPVAKAMTKKSTGGRLWAGRRFAGSICMNDLRSRKWLIAQLRIKRVTIALTVAVGFWPLDLLATNASCEGVAPIQNFGVEKFLEVMDKGSFTSIEKALCLIPEKIRKNAVLINDSKSLQAGTLENPRAIMFDVCDRNAPVQYAISYNGEGSQRQFNSFEIMKFDLSKRPQEQIEFIDVHFDAVAARPKVMRNPESCFACHGFHTDIPRPLWDATGFQPSAYGGRQSSSSMTILSPVDADRATRFIDSYLNHPRYQNLLINT